MTKLETLPLLVIEDSNADFLILKRLMRKMNVQSPIYRCQSGDEALALIYRTGSYQKRKTLDKPGIIMLDLNLPGTDGRAVLARLKQDKELSKIPIIIFTCSCDQGDIDFCYQQGANGYMVKPLGVQELTQVIRAFVDYWLGANISPFLLIN